MTQLRGVSNRLTLSVRKRIFGGFAVVLLLLTVLATVALRGMDAVSAGAGRVSQDSSQATASAEVALQVADARALVVQYALTATMDDQKAAQSSLIRLDQAIEQNRGSGAGLGSDLQALATRYRATVNATIAAVEARRTTIEQMQTAATELRTIVSATAQMLDNDTAPPLLVAAARLADSFGTTDSASARFVASRAPSDASAAGTTLQGLRGAADALAAASTDNRRAQRLVKGLKEPLDRFGESLQRLVADDDKLRAATAERDAASDAVLRATGAQRLAAMASQQDAIGTMLARIGSAHQLGLLTSVGAIGIGLVLAYLIGRSIAGPIGRLTGAMRELAGGALEIAVPHGNRRDELGEMARTVGVFQDHMRKEALLTQQQETERQQAEHDKRAALVNMAETIETDTRIAIEQIGKRTTNMAATADEMRASAARTDVSARSAGSAAAQALANAETVASAADQLSASISEIGSQISQSNDVVGRAVEAGRETRSTIEALNEKVGRIGVVADMIGDIAAKTNLLALNATIEAARAGDAGKGFAVVASEVKQLASQTAHSTQEIARHIAEVRSATGASVTAVGRIEQTINEMNAIAGSIAAAVEEQGAATSEIARNVSETATAANDMTKRIAEVSAEADQTGRHATDVHDNITGLATAVDDLRHSVIQVVRTSSAEVNRRSVPRYQVELPCRLDVTGGGTHTARVADISEGGANVRGGPALQPGDRGNLRVEGFGVALPFSVRSGEADLLRVSFTLDEATNASLRTMIGRLTQRTAA